MHRTAGTPKSADQLRQARMTSCDDVVLIMLDYDRIDSMKFDHIFFTIQFSSGSAENTVSFSAENFRRALRALPSLSSFVYAMTCKNYCITCHMEVTAIDCQ